MTRDRAPMWVQHTARGAAGVVFLAPFVALLWMVTGR